ncbi:MAG: sensor hybrid histidine kinase [Candidatus Brocadiaceae bacterium]|nr:sensor hybrid histidine kinase [Candidatus Brocadiaceae bacterium]
MVLFKSIRSKLLFFCLSLSLIPVAVITVVYCVKGYTALREHQVGKLSLIVESKKTHLHTALNAKRGRIVDFSSDGFIRDTLEKINEDNRNRDRLIKSLNQHLTKYKRPLDTYISDIAVLNTIGVVVASTNQRWIGQGYANTPLFTHGMKASYGNATVHQPLFCVFSKKNSIYITAPLTSRRSASAEKLGIIINCYDLAILHDVMKTDVQMGATGEVYLVNREKRMITPSRFLEHAPLNLIVDTKPVQLAITSGQGMAGIYPDYRGVPVFGVSINMPEYEWLLVAEVDKAELFAPLTSLGVIVSMVSAICVVLVVVAGILYSLSISRPINKLKRTAQKIVLGELWRRVQVKNQDEIGELAASFNTMTEKLHKAIDEANRANEAKSLFLSSMSHELRTPMNSILGFAQVLKNDPHVPLTATQRQSVELILSSGDHLLELINDILDLSRIETGKLSISPEIILVDSVIEEVVAIIKSIAVKYGVTVTVKFVQSGVYIMADRTRLKQVMTNLLTNAVKYNRKNGSVIVSYELRDNDMLRIKVEDTGYGIAEDKLGLLFQPFNRLGKELTNIEGTGIGLTITRRLVELMDGHIGVESVVEKGTMFYVDFKRVQKPVMEMVDITTMQESQKTKNYKNRTILYVEDNPANLMLVQSILKRRPQIELLSAANAESGIAIARAKRPDIIIMDINLPGISGYEALEILRDGDETKKIPVIAISANAMLKDVEKGKVAGFLNYITKPINVSHFLQVVDDVLKETAR